MDWGKTERRYVVVHSVRYIGKEANKWEEQFFTGFDSDAQVVYGINAESLDTIVQSIKKYEIRQMASMAKVSVRYAHNIYHRKTTLSEKTLTKFLRAASALDDIQDKQKAPEGANLEY